MIKKLLVITIGIGVLHFSVACSSTADFVMMNKTASELVAQAEDLMSSGKKAEAVKLIIAVQALHPDDEKVNAILDQLSAEEREALLDSSLLGFNKASRAEVESSTAEKVLWYLPDRIMDFIDAFSVSVGFGAQLGGGVWVTRSLQAVLFVGSSADIGFFQKRNIGVRAETSADVVLGPIGGSAISGTRVGTGGVDQTTSVLWLHVPSEKIYQEYRDYWGVGAKIGLIYLGLEVEYHPIEIYDFLLGLVTFDPLNDDFAHTRRLRFASSQIENLKKMQKMLGEAGEEGIVEYRKKYPDL